ncbi:MAG: molybdopterin-dependent oxidoreductase, partial [bacterium]|nr:molybdopterin-dependent oxidoreductase [bacterium]
MRFKALIDEHDKLTRRYFVGLGVAGAAVTNLARCTRSTAARSRELQAVLDELEYLTRQEDFGTVERGDPLPYTLPPDKLREAGLVRETWQLEVVPDPDSDAKVERPLSRQHGTALDWKGLMKLAETSTVRYMKVMTCNNIAEPLGMGLWEGVPLRDVIWMARPMANVRRVFYHGYHNKAPEQMFRSSLPIGRVLEDPPGEHPVMLCFRLNGTWLSGKRGGPVRLLVPDAYGFKSVKWLTRVTLTNLFHANDTYAAKNNDIDSGMKTFAR